MSPQEVATTDSQRIDKWMWFARVVKSRTIATALVSEGKVRLNRVRVEKPSQSVRAGDVVTIALGSRVRILEVRAAGTRRGPATEAQVLYVDLTPPPPPREEGAQVSGRDPGTGRPTKRDRRLTDKLRDSD